jgi:hypothetical protein
MDEFNNRIAAQRQILEVVNRRRSRKEELFSLSAKAIERWILVDRVDPESHVVQLLKAASAKLFFLANRSQEQVTDDYRSASRDISALLRSIEQEMG